MGLEARCTVRFKRRASEGVAQLETEELRFRGDFRLDIPFASVQSVTAAAGTLRVATDAGVAAFELGKAAETWALKIRYPKPVIEKLGVKPGHVISVLGVDDASFLREAKGRAAEVSIGRAKKDSDLIFFGVEKVPELSRLANLCETMKKHGAIWVIWRKGVPALREDDVRGAALRSGLVDVKVVAFSATHSGLKLMIRKADR